MKEDEPAVASSTQGAPARASLRDRFPGLFSPGEDQIRTFIMEGMIAFDTNALLDVYRLNQQARVEYLATLRIIGDRLFVPHHVGQELLERRVSVIRECSSAVQELESKLAKAFAAIDEEIRAFGNRRGFSEEQSNELVTMGGRARKRIIDRVNDFYTFPLVFDESIRTDEIFEQLEVALDGKIGPPLTDPERHEETGKRRVEAKIPPGYADIKKSGGRSSGDYLIWRQILDEAARTRTPVILISNDQKEDWVREEHGRKIGPRAELIEEMIAEGGIAFHLVNVRSFLVHAGKYLGASVSNDTVAQLDSIDLNRISLIEASEDLSPAERAVAYLTRISSNSSFKESLRPILSKGDGAPVLISPSSFETYLPSGEKVVVSIEPPVVSPDHHSGDE